MKLYIAAPIFTITQLEVVERIKAEAELAGHEVFSPYHNSQGIFNGRKPMECTPAERAQVLTDNIKYLDWCSFLFAWVGGMGGFTDPGVVWEMGYAHAKNKWTIAYIDGTDERQSMNLMLAGTIDAVVKGRPELARAFDLLHEPFYQFKASYDPVEALASDREPVV